MSPGLGGQEETYEELARVNVSHDRTLEVGDEVEIHSLTGSVDITVREEY